MDNKKRPAGKVPANVNINLDTTAILYTDNIFINANEDGLTLNVGQKIVNTQDVRIVARIGMSRNHAKKFIAEMGRLLAITEGHLEAGAKKN